MGNGQGRKQFEFPEFAGGRDLHSNRQEALPERMLTPGEARDAFASARTFKRFQQLMLRVVKQTSPSPVYEYAHVDEKNEDTEWWTPSNPAYTQLVTINECGLPTLCSNFIGDYAELARNNKWDEDWIAMNGCSKLCLLVPNMHFKALYEELRTRGYLVFVTSMKNNQWNHAYPYNVVVRECGSRKTVSSYPYTKQGEQLFGESALAQLDVPDEVIDFLCREAVEICVIDPVENRESKDALFKDIKNICVQHLVEKV